MSIGRVIRILKSGLKRILLRDMQKARINAIVTEKRVATIETVIELTAAFNRAGDVKNEKLLICVEKNNNLPSGNIIVEIKKTIISIFVAFNFGVEIFGLITDTS